MTTLPKASFLMLVRNKQSLYFSLILPVVIMLVFGLVSGNSTVLNGQMSYKDFVVPGLVTMALMQMAVFSVAFVLAQYREKGVLKKLLTTPLKPGKFLAAEVLARLGIAVAQVLLLISVAVLALSFTFNGSYVYLLIAAILGALVFLTLGLAVSGIAKNVETVPAIANIIVFPMLFFGDIFFPVESLPQWLRVVAELLPVSFLADLLRQIMLYGDNLWQLRHDILGLLAWLTLLFLIAARVFKLKED